MNSLHSDHVEAVDRILYSGEKMRGKKLKNKRRNERKEKVKKNGKIILNLINIFLSLPISFAFLNRNEEFEHV